MAELYKKVYFHAVRRAMLENETILKGFMDEIASAYPEETLELLDRLLVAITDNDLFDLVMSDKIPADYGDGFGGLYEDIMKYAQTRRALK